MTTDVPASVKEDAEEELGSTDASQYREQLDELRRLVTEGTKNRFRIGDVLLAVAPMAEAQQNKKLLVTKLIESFARELGIGYSFLTIARSVAAKWPDEYRKVHVPWSVYFYLSRIPAPRRFDVFTTQESWTTSQAQTAYHSWREQESPLRVDDDEVRDLLRYGGRVQTGLLNLQLRIGKVDKVDRYQMQQIAGFVDDLATDLDAVDAELKKLLSRSGMRVG